jgi:uroporphyrinogen-III decarboxylase
VVPNQEPVSRTSDDRLILAETLNPYGLALQKGIDLNAALSDSPEEGNELLESLVSDTREHMRAQLAAGADGVLFRLHGAAPRHSTPMQYGGYYLERDRELLAEIKGKGTHVLFVVGDEEVYLDFVSDLPAEVFAWDAEASGVDSAYIRSIRPGVQASSDPASEIELKSGAKSVAEVLEA